MSSEEAYIKNIENSIRSIKLGTKDKSDAMRSAGFNLNKLKGINEGMYQDLLIKYKSALTQSSNNENLLIKK